MRRSLIASLLCHVALVGALLVGMPGLGERLPVEEAISVEVVDVSELAPTAEPPQPKPAEAAPLPPRQAASPPPPPPAPEPEPAPEPAPAPPPPPQRAAPAPEPPPLAAPEPPPLATPEPKVAEAPPPPPPAPAPTPLKPPEPARAEAPTPRPAVRPAPPKVEAPPRPAPEPPRQVAAKPEDKPAPSRPTRSAPPAEKADDFDALLRSVESQAKRVTAAERRPGTGRAEVVDAGEVVGRNPGVASLSMMEQAGIKRQIESCWNLVGVHVSGPIVVPLRIIMNPDGTPQRVEVQDQARFSADPAYRAVAQSAQRAVLSCKLSLPPEKYAQWRDMVLNFNPQDALSG